jgi:hypothetical protein
VISVCYGIFLKVKQAFLKTCLEMADFFLNWPNFGKEVAENLWKDLATVIFIITSFGTTIFFIIIINCRQMWAQCLLPFLMGGLPSIL